MKANETSIRSLAVGQSVVIKGLSWFGKDKQLEENEMVFVESQEGKARFWVDLNLSDGYVILRPTEEP